MTTGRLAQAGFGFNTTTAGIEFDIIQGSPTISTTSPYTGTYCGRVSSLSSGSAQGFALRHSTTAISTLYCQARVKFITLPTGTTNNFFLTLNASGSANQGFGLYINASGVIGGRYYSSGALYQTFTTTGTISDSAWHLVEVYLTTTGTSTSAYEVRLDGVTIGSATGATMQASLQNYLTVGLNLNGEANTVGEVYVDDMVVNNSLGTWPGGLQVGYLVPNGDGGSHAFNTDAGAGSSSNYSHVGDPSSSTSYVSVIQNNATTVDTYTMSDTGLAAGSTIDCVMGFVRGTNQTAGTANSQIKLTMTANGSTSTSAAWAPNISTPTYRNGPNASTIAFPAMFTLYTDPASAAWTVANLDGLTMGLTTVGCTVSSVNVARVDAVWASYTYIPAAPATNPDLLGFIASAF